MTNQSIEKEEKNIPISLNTGTKILTLRTCKNTLVCVLFLLIPISVSKSATIQLNTPIHLPFLFTFPTKIQTNATNKYK
jgi:hypothetical protein